MGKKPIVSVAYKNERISIKNSLPYLKCVSFLCGPQADLWPFYGFLCRWFSLYIKVCQGWALQGSGPTDPPKENGHWTPHYRWKIVTRPETQITHTRGGRQSLAAVDINTQERKQLEQETVSHPEFKPRFSQWLQTGMVAEICDLWFALGAKASWSKITNGKDNYRVLLRRNLEAIGAVGANLRQLSFSGSVEPLRWSAQPW